MPELDFGRTKYSTSALQKDAQKLQDELWLNSNLQNWKDLLSNKKDLKLTIYLKDWENCETLFKQESKEEANKLQIIY